VVALKLRTGIQGLQDRILANAVPNLLPTGDRHNSLACAESAPTSDSGTKRQSDPAPKEGQLALAQSFIVFLGNHSKLFPNAQSAFRARPTLAVSRVPLPNPD
jgi:hypothetical protein